MREEARFFLCCEELSRVKCFSFRRYMMRWKVMGWAGVSLGMENGNHLARVLPDC